MTGNRFRPGAEEPGRPLRDPLTAHYPEIRRAIADLAARSWPALEEQVARHLTAVPLPMPTLLPVASAVAVGGDPRRGVPVGAASGLLIVALRWFDDLQDRDRDESLWQEVGAGRATNLAAAALSLSWQVLAEAPHLPRSALCAWGDGCLALARGQDDDLQAGTVRSLPDYLDMLRSKTGAAFGTACRTGALAGGAGAAEADALGRFGETLGLLVQVLDDLDGTFHPDGVGDLAMGKVTLPLLYGLHADHPGRDELRDLVESGRFAAEGERVVEILEELGAREYLVWMALERRRDALACLDELPPAATAEARAGRATLVRGADAVLAGWESLLEPPGGRSPEGDGASPGKDGASPEDSLADDFLAEDGQPPAHASPAEDPARKGTEPPPPGYFGGEG